MYNEMIDMLEGVRRLTYRKLKLNEPDKEFPESISSCWDELRAFFLKHMVKDRKLVESKYPKPASRELAALGVATQQTKNDE